ncbi:hypothetical protein LWP59_26340 [Amycolatopsis acidiphila]|uniref:Uncharacterized protein n=1 Tax=Amycolatopsis acidiphila TaxID=715473 RepID=A0A557ZZR7_9PSEU|nr:hypothetical protein [Amycolatopsis acidiphila]TVT17515.1 hypothetical protein FNH06_30995 [Amycolatopsis acidiphila]UIJ57649.1 hypothetical protein LWP59_26340 [Amycolatopsis acidiphila]GHG95549.1 hypothetical protein GCM10017788_74090 [Amycolatopsis acidiphila]
MTGPPPAVPDDDQLAQVVALDLTGKEAGGLGEPDTAAVDVAGLEPPQRGRVCLVTVREEAVGHPIPAPAALPATVHE